MLINVLVAGPKQSKQFQYRIQVLVFQNHQIYGPKLSDFLGFQVTVKSQIGQTRVVLNN